MKVKDDGHVVVVAKVVVKMSKQKEVLKVVYKELMTNAVLSNMVMMVVKMIRFAVKEKIAQKS